MRVRLVHTMGSLPVNVGIKHLVQMIMQKNSYISALETAIEDLQWTISRDGVLRWQVKLSPLQQAVYAGPECERIFLSRDFYTPEGHRMGAQLQLNFGGVSQGIALSLHIFLKEGPDDSYIEWPLPYSSASFQVRRHDGGEPWERIYPVDHLDPTFSRPLEGENKRFGFVNFISMDDLLCPENKFVEDDTVSIMISVKE